MAGMDKTSCYHNWQFKVVRITWTPGLDLSIQLLQPFQTDPTPSGWEHSSTADVYLSEMDILDPSN